MKSDPREASEICQRFSDEANMAKLLAADASWEAANVAVQTYGGLISTNLILSYVAEHVLGLPRSY